MSCDWESYWGDTAAELTPMLDALVAQYGARCAGNLQNEAHYSTLAALKQTLAHALGEQPGPNVDWVGGSIDGSDVAAKAAAVTSGLDQMMNNPGCSDNGNAGWLRSATPGQPAIDAGEDLYRGARDCLGME